MLAVQSNSTFQQRFQRGGDDRVLEGDAGKTNAQVGFATGCSILGCGSHSLQYKCWN
jgi:hypothetical protein